MYSRFEKIPYLCFANIIFCGLSFHFFFSFILFFFFKVKRDLLNILLREAVGRKAHLPYNSGWFGLFFKGTANKRMKRGSSVCLLSCHLRQNFFFFFVFCPCRTTPMAYGVSQARSEIEL